MAIGIHGENGSQFLRRCCEVSCAASDASAAGIGAARLEVNLSMSRSWFKKRENRSIIVATRINIDDINMIYLPNR